LSLLFHDLVPHFTKLLGMTFTHRLYWMWLRLVW